MGSLENAETFCFDISEKKSRFLGAKKIAEFDPNSQSFGASHKCIFQPIKYSTTKKCSALKLSALHLKPSDFFPSPWIIFRAFFGPYFHILLEVWTPSPFSLLLWTQNKSLLQGSVLMDKNFIPRAKFSSQITDIKVSLKKVDRRELWS